MGDDKLRERRHQKADRFAAWVHTEKPDWATLGRELFRFSEETRAEALAEGRERCVVTLEKMADAARAEGERVLGVNKTAFLEKARVLREAIRALTQQEPEAPHGD